MLLHGYSLPAMQLPLARVFKTTIIYPQVKCPLLKEGKEDDIRPSVPLSRCEIKYTIDLTLHN